jgi:hypothetical protein
MLPPMAEGHAASIDRRETHSGNQTTFWQQMAFSRKTCPEVNPAPVRALPNHSSEAA